MERKQKCMPKNVLVPRFSMQQNLAACSINVGGGSDLLYREQLSTTAMIISAARTDTFLLQTILEPFFPPAPGIDGHKPIQEWDNKNQQDGNTSSLLTGTHDLKLS